MKRLKTVLMLCTFLCCATWGIGQTKGYAPFTYNAEDFMLSLNVKESAWTKKFAPVLQKHHRNPEEASEWSGLFDTIIGMQATDLFATGHVIVDSEDDLVKITAGDKDEVATLMKSLKPVIASPEKLDAFLTDFDATLEKAKKKK